MSDLRALGILLITGMPGAGKSTVSRLVAQRLSRAARVDGDTVGEMVLSGRVKFFEEPADEAARQTELTHRNLCSLAAHFFDAGFTPLIDGVISQRTELERFVKLLTPRPVFLVVLAPGIDVCRHRNRVRDPADRFDFDGYGELDAQMRNELGGSGWWFDTSGLREDETADLLISEAAWRAPVCTP
ncbi:AAA family ATPase [Krasilnikovia sp. MM14-A1259]|uniref:AAA family ATPase n=1 Tax=Krasilnikovia sp. MM14-A1259 TaxID=3373539 RepID=UPI0038212194